MSNFLTPHLVSLMTSFSPWMISSVVTEFISNTTPAPLLTIFSALSGWSPSSGIITIGTAWHKPSNRPWEPAWVMKARAPGCANTRHMQRQQRLWHVRHHPSAVTDMFQDELQWTHTPNRSFWGTHFIIITLAGMLSGTCPVYLHITCQSVSNCRFSLRFQIYAHICSEMFSYLLWNLSESF